MKKQILKAIENKNNKPKFVYDENGVKVSISNMQDDKFYCFSKISLSSAKNKKSWLDYLSIFTVDDSDSHKVNFDSMTKKEIDSYAEEKGIILDGRKTKEDMILELKEQLN